MGLELSKSVRTGIDKPSSVLAQLPTRLGSLQSFFQQACFAGPWFTEVQETISTLGGGVLLSGTGSGQVIQAALGLAGHTLKVQKMEQLTSSGER